MIFNIAMNKPETSIRCILYTKKGICFAIWNEHIERFVSPYLLDILHEDIIYWQPLENPPGIPLKFLRQHDKQEVEYERFIDRLKSNKFIVVKCDEGWFLIHKTTRKKQGVAIPFSILDMGMRLGDLRFFNGTYWYIPLIKN